MCMLATGMNLKLSPQQQKILNTWLPLAASWLLMGIEMPAITAVMARLSHPEISLATHGGVVFPISLIIEAPIIMLLSASVALCKDWSSYQRIYRFMMASGFLLTLVHVLVAFTPLFDVVVKQVLGVPPEIVEPASIGLRIMTPWTWAIAYRRFQQGVLIRFGHPEAVSIGTAIRLLSGAMVLATGLIVGTIPGFIIGATTQAVGTVSEAIFAGLRVRPVLRKQIKVLPSGTAITWKKFAAFYIPLALTSILNQVWQPVGSAAISRMPAALESLAVWSVVSGLVFMLRSLGYAYNEVVVALLDQEGSSIYLWKFTKRLLTGVSLLHLMIAITPLAYLWFNYVSGISPVLVSIALTGFWLAIPMPALSVLQSWFQGALLYQRETRAIPESMAIFLLTVLIVLGAGVLTGKFIGLYVAMFAFSFAIFMQVAWMWFRSRRVLSSIRERDRLIEWLPTNIN